MPNTVAPERNSLSISGRNDRNAEHIARMFQRNIPEFHKNSPLSTNTFANSKFGFSVKVFTVYISESGLSAPAV